LRKLAFSEPPADEYQIQEENLAPGQKWPIS